MRDRLLLGLLSIVSALAFAKIYKKLRRRRAIRSLIDSKSSKVNALVGIALGDAFGAGVEMQSSEQMSKHFQDRQLRFVDTRTSVYAVNYWKGRYTDDAEHSLAVVRLLAESADTVPSSARLVDCFEREWLNRAYSASACTQLIANLRSLFAGRIRTTFFSASASTQSPKKSREVPLSSIIYMSIFAGRQGMYD